MAGSPETRRGASGWERYAKFFYGALFVIMMVELVVLILQNRELKATIAELQTALATAGRASAPALEVGEIVEPLTLPMLDGEMARLAYDEPDRESLLLIFSPDCPACAENMKSWKKVERSNRSEQRRLVYISTGSEERTRQYAADHELTGAVALADQGALAGYKVSYIPTTLLVAPGGVVKKVWVGVLPEDAITELQLPGA